MPKAFICNACEKDYDTARGLRKHHKKYPSHKENANNEKPLQAVAAVNNFLDVSSSHRAARLKELLKHLTTDEFSKIILPSVAKQVPTSAYLLSKSQHADLEGQVKNLSTLTPLFVKTTAHFYASFLVTQLHRTTQEI